MNRRPTLLRRLLASLTMVTLTVVGVVVPTLDRLERSDRTVLESEHDSGACVSFHHHHSICTQVGANAAAVATSQPGWGHDVVHRVPTPPRLDQLQDRDAVSAHLPRAPPAHA